MLHLRTCGAVLRACATTFAAALVLLTILDFAAQAQTLVGDPFVHPLTGWVDAFPPPVRAGNWRLSLHTPALIDTNNANPPTSGAVTNGGAYEPDVLVQNSFLAPAVYDLNATMRTNDDDLMGLVWNYQDPNNYFRVGFRQQPASGNFGGTEGVSVQKIANGVVAQLVPSSPMAGPAAIDQAMIDNRTPFNVKVAVNGSSYTVFFNGTQVATGTDAALVAGRKIGVQSWAQQADAAAVTPFWGSEFESVSVTQGANTLYSQSFGNRSVKFRQVVMTNAVGASGLTGTNSRETLGNFGVDTDNPWIYQQSNGFLNATASNTDFIGPGVVVDEPGATNFSNYEMRTRIGTTDNDGIGVLVRVKDDNNFYRINFVNEGPGAGTTRPPAGMSVQKLRNGVWSELYRETGAPLFVYTPGTVGDTPATPSFPSFDLTVGAVGNALKIQVRDKAGNIINYPLVTDSTDPILTGSVGLQTWGTDNVYFSGFGGTSTPLLKTLTSLKDVDLIVDRATGNISIKNNDPTVVNIKGVSILSPAGALNASNWSSIANNYDRPAAPTPGNGSVDADDSWTIVSMTPQNLNESELAGNGGTVAASGTINFGNAWTKSRLEDLIAELALPDGSTVSMDVLFINGPNGAAYPRSDLNVDGIVNASDWPLYYPNLLKNLSSLTGVQRALAGDLDGDGDNDVNDFSIFKADYDIANGAGAFEALLASVPEPSAIVLLLISSVGSFAIRRRCRNTNRVIVVALGVLGSISFADLASAVPVDFTTLTAEAFPPAASFPAPAWTTTPTSASLNSNADATVLYSPSSALNKRYIGRLTPGTDDDVVGFVLGFEPNDAQIFSTADYLLIDWKGANQNFDFTDGDPINFHHSATLAGDMPAGLALSRVTGSPTADELWQHADLAENPTGGVAQLARGTTLGTTPYNRLNGSHLFDIRYSPSNVTVLVDGVEQFNQNGSFPDGRFGLYSAWQGPTATFSSFDEVEPNFVPLSATVDRSNGNITLKNANTGPLSFDYYQLNSASSSLKTASWNSLSDQNFQASGAGAHQKWQEAGGSNAATLGEAFLDGSSTLAPNASISIGNAYNNALNGEDLVLTFRLSSGLILPGTVQYVGTAAGLVGDYNKNGAVDAADYVLWRDTLNTSVTPGSGADGDGNGMIQQNDYTVWRANFGKPSGAGSGAALDGAANVPEPVSVVVLLGAMVVGVSCRYRQRLG